MKRIGKVICLMTMCLFFANPGLAEDIETLREFPINGLEGLVKEREISFDKNVSYDGGGSVKIRAFRPTTVKLFETGDLKVDAAELIYSAKAKTKGLTGKAFLEMWCHFKEKGSYFSRGLKDWARGDKDWTEISTKFLLKKGQKPDNVSLNIVINGTGTIWVDRIELSKRPLKQ
jgi:hypothetical protein